MHPIIHPTIRLTTHPTATQPPIHPSTHPTIHPSIHPSIHPFIHSSIHSSIHPATPPSIPPCNPPASRPSVVRNPIPLGYYNRYRPECICSIPWSREMVESSPPTTGISYLEKHNVTKLLLKGMSDVQHQYAYRR